MLWTRKRRRTPDQVYFVCADGGCGFYTAGWNESGDVFVLVGDELRGTVKGLSLV